MWGFPPLMIQPKSTGQFRTSKMASPFILLPLPMIGPEMKATIRTKSFIPLLPLAPSRFRLRLCPSRHPEEPGRFTWPHRASAPGPWSNSLSLNVTPPGPTLLVSPSGKLYKATPTYTWSAVPGSTRYYLWVNDSRSTKIKQWYTDEQAGCPSGTGTCSVTPSVGLVAGEGRWWVQTWNSAGTGPWSLSLDFNISTPPAPEPISPSGTIADTTPTYIWHAFLGATKYYLWVNDSTGHRFLKSYTADELGCPSETDICSVTPTTELAPGSGRWYVQGWSPVGYGTWSNATPFYIRP